jgi:hypothetical protein
VSRSATSDEHKGDLVVSCSSFLILLPRQRPVLFLSPSFGFRVQTAAFRGPSSSRCVLQDVFFIDFVLRADRSLLLTGS